MLGALAVGVIVRLPFLNHPLLSDEAAYAYIAQHWLAGELLYEDLFIDRFQAIFVVYGWLQAVAGLDAWTIRLLAAFASCISTLLIFAIARQLTLSDRQILGATWLYSVISGAPHIQGYSGNAETFQVPFALASVLLLLHAQRSPKWAAPALYAAGVCVGCSTQFKFSGFSYCLIWFVLLIRAHPSQSWHFRILWGLAFPLGVGTALFPSVLHGIQSVGWDRYSYAVFWYRVQANSLIGSSVLFQLKEFFRSVAETAPAIALPIVLGLVGRKCWAETLKSDNLAGLTVATWSICGFLGIAMGGNWFAHYYMFALPPLCILAGPGMILFESLDKRDPWRVAGLVAGVLYLTFELSVITQIRPKLAHYALKYQPRYLEADKVVSLLRSKGKSGDRVYVAYEGGNIVYRSGMKHATPFLFWRDVAQVPGAFDRTIEIVENGGADFVVTVDDWSMTHDQNVRFRSIVRTHFQVIGQFGRVQVYQISGDTER